MQLEPYDRLLNWIRAIVPQDGLFTEGNDNITYRKDWHVNSAKDMHPFPSRYVRESVRLTAFIIGQDTDEEAVMQQTGIDRCWPEYCLSCTPYQSPAIPVVAKKLIHIGLRSYIEVVHRPEKNSTTGIITYRNDSTHMEACVNVYLIPDGVILEGYDVQDIEGFLTNDAIKDEIGDWLRKRKGEYDALYLDMKNGSSDLKLPVRQGETLNIFLRAQSVDKLLSECEVNSKNWDLDRKHDATHCSANKSKESLARTRARKGELGKNTPKTTSKKKVSK